MPAIPRLALGSIQPGVDSRPLVWALLEAFRQQGIQVQGFLSRACFAGYLEQAALIGLNPRHLDSWLMSPQSCREAFVHSAANCDLAIVEGTFVPSVPNGGSLDRICNWLNLPRIGIVDVGRLSSNELPEPPVRLDGLLLDRVQDDADFAQWAANFEARWGVPVLGGLGDASPVRLEAEAMAAGRCPLRTLSLPLGRSLFRYTNLSRIIEVARMCEWSWPINGEAIGKHCCENVVVALAYDELR